MALTLAQARRRIDGILQGFRGATGQLVLPPTLTAGKVYEAWTLCRVLERLHAEEGYDITLKESTALRLRSAPGPIDRSFAHFLLERQGSPRLEVWTDIEFVTLSAYTRRVRAPSRCDFHEVDIVVVPEGAVGRPPFDEVLLAVECKNTPYRKELLRSLLGVRRELSLLATREQTVFHNWPRRFVPARPPSCLLAYSTDARVDEFAPPGEVFGIDFVHEPLP